MKGRLWIGLAVLSFATAPAAGCGGGDGANEGAAKPAKPHVGFLSASASPAFVDALRSGLEELGYVDGQNIRLELRPTKDEDALPAIANELVGADVDLLIAGGTKAVEAARQATSSIPIVMTNSGDPVGTGLVKSLVRPGGNVTGLSQNSPALAPKRLELVKDAFPGTSKVAVLLNPEHPSTKLSLEELQAAAPDLGIELVILEVTKPSGVAGAVRRAKRRAAGAMVVLRDPFTVNEAAAIARAARRARLPAVYETGNFLDAGGLMLYGPDLAVLYKRSARYVDKILKGADPATLPIEQPTEFELVINTKVLAELGVEIPEQVRLRAKEV